MPRRGDERTRPGKGTARLPHLFALSDGLQVDGGDLVRELARQLPETATVTCSLAGDGVRFRETLVFCGGGPERRATAVVASHGFLGVVARPCDIRELAEAHRAVLRN